MQPRLELSTRSRSPVASHGFYHSPGWNRDYPLLVQHSAKDIRDKKDLDGNIVRQGLFDSSGVLKQEHEAEFEQIVNQVGPSFRRYHRQDHSEEGQRYLRVEHRLIDLAVRILHIEQ